MILVRVRYLRSCSFGAALITLLSAWACSSGGEGERASAGVFGRRVDPPALAGALAPQLTLVGGSVAASWLEPVEREEGAAHRLRFSRLIGGRWSQPVTVAEGADLFANWADVPAVVETGRGDLLAHWLAKTGDGTYAYSIFLARSVDGGVRWEPHGRLNADVTDAEHGFVSWLAEGDAARAVWLDGRAMVDGGAMTLRTAIVGDEIGGEEVLDEMTCECCSTDIALIKGGPVVVYRDRSVEEIRDINVVRRSRGEWSKPERLNEDGWRIEGCPVNGPAIAAAGSRTAIGWYTAAEGSPKVQLALSLGAAETTGRVFLIDDESPLGRVDVALDEQGDAWIVWLASRGEAAELLLRRVRFEGSAGETILLAETSASRSSGFPSLLASGGALHLMWVEVTPPEASTTGSSATGSSATAFMKTESRRIRFLELPLADLRG